MTDKPLTPAEEIEYILWDNITFSPKAGNYVIHGAVEKFIEQERRRYIAFFKFIENKNYMICITPPQP